MGCSGNSSADCGGKTGQQMAKGSPAYKGQMKKPSAMVSKNSVGFSFGPYGARKASEVVGRAKMPALPKKRR